MPGLIATDLDGTLLTPSHELSPATIAAIAAATDAGVEVVLASSRGPSAMRRIIAQLHLTEPVEFIAAQGAYTGSIHEGDRLTLIHETTIPLGLAQEVVTVAGRLDIGVNWISGLEWLVSRIDATTEHQIAVLQERPTRRDLGKETRPPHKLMLIVPEDAADTIPSLIGSLPPALAATRSHPTFIEITAGGVDKGAALARLCARRGISPAEVVAIGDGHNDLAMFEFAGTSIAMANGAADVIARATRVTGSNHDDGVAHAITALLGDRNGVISAAV